jgi:ankyrin repeat protein
VNGLKAYEEVVRSDNAELLECIFPLIIDDIRKRNMDKEGSYGLLHLAATGSPKCLDLLLARKEMTISEICNSRDRSSALHFAVMSDKPDNVRILLRHGANVNQADAYGNTPLHLAASKGQVKMCRMLIEFGAKKDRQNKDESTPEDVAEMENHRAVLMLFARN